MRPMSRCGTGRPADLVSRSGGTCQALALPAGTPRDAALGGRAEARAPLPPTPGSVWAHGLTSADTFFYPCLTFRPPARLYTCAVDASAQLAWRGRSVRSLASTNTDVVTLNGGSEMENN